MSILVKNYSMPKHLYCIILVLISASSYSQKKEFCYGEKYKSIEKEDFEKRLKSNLLPLQP